MRFTERIVDAFIAPRGQHCARPSEGPRHDTATLFHADEGVSEKARDGIRSAIAASR